MRTILIGLGNPILGDDAVGWKVVELVEHRLRQLRHQISGALDIEYLSIGGLGLMERLVGYDRAIIVDAIFSGNSAPGTISTQLLEDLFDPSAGHTLSVHDTSLQDAIHLARKIGVRMPVSLMVVGIETVSIDSFSESLTARVEAAIPRAVDIVIDLLAK